MNIKKKKVILNDEVKEFLSIMASENETENENNSFIKNNFENKVDKYAHKFN